MNNIMKKVKSFLFYLVVAVLVVFISLELFVPDTTIKVFGFKSYVVTTQSMEPEINVFDIVVDRNFDVENLEVGDIITFRVDADYDGEKDVVTHYIADIIVDSETGKISFKTHRHFENEDDLYQDPWTIDSSDVLGQYWFTIPKLGYVVEFIKSPFGIAIIFLNIIIISGIVYLIKKKDSEEESNLEDSEPKMIEQENLEKIKKEPTEPKQAMNLKEMTVAELKTLCKLYNVVGYSKLKKAELITELEKHVK